MAFVEGKITMPRFGCHLSSAKGYLAMGRTAVRIGADTFQFFTRNPRGGRARALDPEDIANYREYADEHGLGPILAHASYTLNPATADPKLRDFVLATIRDDLFRLDHLPDAMYNLHPGHGGGGPDAVGTVARVLDAVVTPAVKTTVLLETMVGQGTELGGLFEDLRAIIDLAESGDRVGVCLDTCHVFAAGYDIVGDLDGVLERFDRVLGLSRLRAVHLNDSVFGLGRRKDRHATIGTGEIGLRAITRIVGHPSLRDLPFYLETPNDDDGHGREIAEVRKLYRRELARQKRGEGPVGKREEKP